MSNSYFQFKKFTVNQEGCAMKVCTDACLFGAYISSAEKDATNAETNILDIGTGTGLLSIIVAQKIAGNIEAIEIDEQAYKQAVANFSNSPWKTRLSAFHADVTSLKLGKKYELIISNPPFFSDSLKSENMQRNVAKHATSLSFGDLISVAYSSLAENGRFYVLLPYKEFSVFEKIAIENQLHILKKINVRPTPSLPFFRTMGTFSKKALRTVKSELLTIKDSNNKYTNEFTELLKDYYLYL